MVLAWHAWRRPVSDAGQARFIIDCGSACSCAVLRPQAIRQAFAED
jgi:hypothetical protein